MRKLSDVFLFQQISKGDPKLMPSLKGINLRTDAIDIKTIEDNLNVINRRFNYQLKNKTINLLNSGYIVPVYSQERLRFSTAIPSFLYSNSGTPIAVVNLTNYAVKRKNTGEIEIDNRTLYALLESGTILREYFYNFNKISMNAVIAKEASQIYAKMFCKVLDKLFAINLNKMRSDICHYLASKFFLLYQMERANNETLESIAFLACPNDTTKPTLKDADLNFSEDAYSSIAKFIENLAKHVDGLSHLNIRVFLREWLTMIGESGMLALEYLPSFLFTIFSATAGARINNEYIIEPLVAKNANKLYAELSRIIN